MDGSTQEQTNSRPWLYKKGQSGNPGGRPKGSKSLKTYIRERFERMTDEEREEFLDGLDKKTLWEMGEGKAEAKTEVKADVDLTFKWAADDNDNDTLQTEAMG